jgi:hypothetical protein
MIVSEHRMSTFRLYATNYTDTVDKI